MSIFEIHGGERHATLNTYIVLRTLYIQRSRMLEKDVPEHVPKKQLHMQTKPGLGNLTGRTLEAWLSF